jgi:aromatic ring-opening dioxygenase LigB subunit
MQMYIKIAKKYQDRFHKIDKKQKENPDIPMSISDEEDKIAIKLFSLNIDIPELFDSSIKLNHGQMARLILLYSGCFNKIIPGN